MDIRVFEDFIDQNANVKSDFLFKHYHSTTLGELPYALSLISFTSELILFRRTSFPGPLVITAELVDALTNMGRLQPHILMRLANETVKSGSASRDIMEAYYGDHVPRLRLGCFLGRGESATLWRNDLGLRSVFRDTKPDTASDDERDSPQIL